MGAQVLNPVFPLHNLLFMGLVLGEVVFSTEEMTDGVKQPSNH